MKLAASNSDNESSSKSILAEILCVIYVLWRHNYQETEKKFQLVELFSRVNEVKPYGLVQQLILRMLRDLIVQYSDSHLLNGNNFHDHLLKILACLLWCLEFNQVIILWKVSKRNYNDWKPNLLLALLTLLELYLHLQTFFLIFSSYRF